MGQKAKAKKANKYERFWRNKGSKKCQRSQLKEHHACEVLLNGAYKKCLALHTKADPNATKEKPKTQAGKKLAKAKAKAKKVEKKLMGTKKSSKKGKKKKAGKKAKKLANKFLKKLAKSAKKTKKAAKK